MKLLLCGQGKRLGGPEPEIAVEVWGSLRTWKGQEHGIVRACGACPRRGKEKGTGRTRAGAGGDRMCGRGEVSVEESLLVPGQP